MAETRPREFVTRYTWLTVVVGPIDIGTISSESNAIRIALTTTGTPTDLKQGHLLHPREGWNFELDEGETLYAIADDNKTSLITTY